jgi:TonB family protein
MNKNVCFALFFSVALIIAFPLKVLADKTEEQYNHARELLEQNDFQGAQAELESILNKKPNYEKAKVLLGVTLTRLSQQAANKGDRSTAVADLRAALQLEPDEAYWHKALGELLKVQGDAEGARKEMALAAQLSPDDWFLARAAGSGASPETQKEGGANAEVNAPPRTRPYTVGNGVTPPVPIEKPEPPYSEKARRFKYQGSVVLSIVVNAQGEVEQASVVKPLGLGLDQNALQSVRTWKFQPATLNDTPVPVRVMIEVSFRLF